MAYDFAKMTKTGRIENAEKLKLDMKKAATRVNDYNPAHYLSYKSDKASAEIRKCTGPGERKQPNAAPPATYNTLKDKGTYIPGMGEVPVAMRPGALDYKKYPSRGIG